MPDEPSPDLPLDHVIAFCRAAAPLLTSALAAVAEPVRAAIIAHAKRGGTVAVSALAPAGTVIVEALMENGDRVELARAEPVPGPNLH